MEINSLSQVAFGQLFEAFSQAFAQYDVQIDEEEFRTMIRRRGYDPALSFTAFDNNKASITLKTIQIPHVVQPIHINEYKDILPAFWDFHPSWQNSFESIERTKEDFICKGVFSDGNLIAYSVLEPGSGDVTQLAVRPGYRRKGIGSMLLREIVNDNTFPTLKIVNTDITCDSIKAFLSAHSIEPKGKQYEMIKML